MEPRAVVFRALAVPDVLQEGNKVQAGAARLLELASVPAVPVEAGWERIQQRHNEAGMVIEALCQAFEAGDLDHLIGNYPNGREKKAIATAIGNGAAEHAMRQHAFAGGQLIHEMTVVLLDCVLDYVRTHPFNA